MKADLSLVKQTLRRAEEYICWYHEPTLKEVTLKRYGSVYSWPLSWLLPQLKKLSIRHHLTLLDWSKKSLADVTINVNRCCKILSERLDDKKFFYSNDRPTELDALVFGHLFTILTTELPQVDLAGIVKKQQNLVNFCQRIEKDFFARRTVRPKT